MFGIVWEAWRCNLILKCLEGWFPFTNYRLISFIKDVISNENNKLLSTARKFVKILQSFDDKVKFKKSTNEKELLFDLL